MRELFYGITEQGKAGKHRLEDARALLRESRFRCAMYVAGYAVECLLKTKLMQMFNCRHLQELEDTLQAKKLLATQATFFTHQLELLLRLTKSGDRLRQHQTHWRLFGVVNRWIPAWRYTADPSRSEEAVEFVEAVDKLSHWIETNV